MTDQKTSSKTDIENLFSSIKKIDLGKSIDNTIVEFPPIKRPFLFLNIQEYYRQIENNSKVLSSYINDNTSSSIVVILKLSLILIFYSNKPDHSIVHDSVELSKKFKKDKLVNGVLRNILRNKEKIKKEYQNFLLPRSFVKIIEKTFLDKNIQKYIAQSFFHIPQNYQICLTKKKGAIYDDRVFYLDKNLEKDCFVQDIGNFEIIKSTHQIFDNKKILDVCAAPGGKSILLNSLGFDVTALDKSQEQINKMHENLKRLHLKLPIIKINFLNFNEGNKYSSILLDAPCSSLGTFRRNPDVINKINIKSLLAKQKQQVQLANKAIKILNNGGFLLYIVCSFHEIETIEVIDKLLQKHKNLSVVELKSDKMIKNQYGYFINPKEFETLGGSDIFFIAMLAKN